MNAKFQLRTTLQIDLRSAMSEAIAKALAYKMPFQCCMNCKYFDFKNDKDLCTKFNLKPPARIVIYGCPSYDDEDDVPF